MLHQEINLYRSFATPRPAAQFLTWKRYLISQIVGAALLTIIYLYSSLHILYLQHEKTTLTTEADTLQKEFYVTKNHYPQLFFSHDVGQTVTELQKQLDAQAKILQTLQTPTPFSQNLSALSTIITPDVWLTKILISNHDGKITLEGSSLSPSAIQQFIFNLSHDKLFANYTVSVNDIQSGVHDAKDQSIHFELYLVKK